MALVSARNQNRIYQKNSLKLRRLIKDEEDDSTNSSESEEEILLRYPEIPDSYPNDDLEAWRTRVRRDIEDQ
ncbi:hypothetical protein FOXG_22775 [Fusarium oxysporum f. sp. lycopersici 4287]|uniref:Uncharacterized protein n=1 Tax=Fusarium oxysporum f. sp. lycopersici (strain 4287 / CBS 123668 / FGSC 9935 / NRRL 34936) TaxID=426428 RepID=A0A0J9WCE5_FUSO4|nr:uncharacterized protein FOXG_22775 [Fusarium oxysporum f. sp. lycopersici 4287]KNB20220.1 hypothetical protein FOXG_22775 [Fusarium oxysporum f. sp. lycopersici 4287]